MLERLGLGQRPSNVASFLVDTARDFADGRLWTTLCLEQATGAAYWLALAVTAAGFTYYNIPLLETGRPTIGANQYGITYENLAAQQNELLVFQPLITHSVTKTTAHFAFHVQMIADFLTVEEVGEKMLAELARNGNRNDASSCDCCIGAFCDERRGVG